MEGGPAGGNYERFIKLADKIIVVIQAAEASFILSLPE